MTKVLVRGAQEALASWRSGQSEPKTRQTGALGGLRGSREGLAPEEGLGGERAKKPDGEAEGGQGGRAGGGLQYGNAPTASANKGGGRTCCYHCYKVR